MDIIGMIKMCKKMEQELKTQKKISKTSFFLMIAIVIELILTLMTSGGIIDSIAVAFVASIEACFCFIHAVKNKCYLWLFTGFLQLNLAIMIFVKHFGAI